MRKILFRGKILGGEKWVEGWLKPFTNGGYDGKDDRLCIQNSSHSFDIYEVVPETVGQYTGLTDRNGKKIFEGDIVKGIAYSSEWRGAIIWIDEIASFGLYHGHEVAWENSSILKRAAKGMNDEFTAEVIGNIYDNPELLKGAEEDD